MDEQSNNLLVNPFGEWVRKHREANKWSLRVLEGKLDKLCSASYLSQLENDQYRGKKGNPMKPGIDIVDALAVVFRRPINEARQISEHPLLNEEFADTQLEDIDGELAFLFAKSRDWSEENRQEAYANAAAIMRRYQEKEQNQKSGKKPIDEHQQPSDVFEQSLREVETGLEEAKRGQTLKAKIQIPHAGKDALQGLPKAKYEKGKIVEDEKTKKPSGPGEGSEGSES